MRTCKWFLIVTSLLSLSAFAFLARGRAAELPDTPADTGTLCGTVTLENSGGALHKATVLIVPLGRTTETDENGGYESRDVPVGTYELVVQAPALATERRKAQVTAGGTATVDFEMRLATLRERVTVTAKGREETAFDSFQAVNVLDTIQLIEKPRTSLGEALEGEPGVAKRSFGPGTARPVIRGFDGDRVLIMKDGISTGTLSSQSGDHGETIDLFGLERIEVVKGPATLLYGSNAIGGVVNAITPHGEVHEHVHEGPSGYLSAVGGSANGLGGGGVGFEYGVKNWLMWVSGGGNRTGDYSTPIGEVLNSQTRLANGGGGFGWFGPKAFASLNFGFEDFRYGIPPLEDEVVTSTGMQTALDRPSERYAPPIPIVRKPAISK